MFKGSHRGLPRVPVSFQHKCQGFQWFWKPSRSWTWMQSWLKNILPDMILSSLTLVFFLATAPSDLDVANDGPNPTSMATRSYTIPVTFMALAFPLTSMIPGAGRSSEVERSLMVRWVVGSILHGVDPLSYFSLQPVLYDWCIKGCGMVHIKEPLLLIDKSSLCGGSGFLFSLSEWSLTICLTPYNRR